MKTILFLSTLVFGLMWNTPQDPFDFDKAWRDVSKFIDQGLPESALERVKEIYTAAKLEKRSTQMVKSILFMGNLSVNKGEDGVDEVMNLYTKEIEETTSPFQNILRSQYADFLFNYFNVNRYQISQRTSLSNNDVSFRTMTSEGYLTLIGENYLKSLEGLNSNESVDKYKEIFNEYNEAGKLFRPTLFEVLAEKALDFFGSGNGSIVEPSYKFNTNKKEYFLPYNQFVKLDIESKDEASLIYQTLKIYQSILSRKSSQHSRASFDLMRLQFVYNHGKPPLNQQIFRDALEDLANDNKNIDYYTVIIAQLASEIMQNTSDPKTASKVKEMCEKAIEKYPSSEGAAQCRSILQSIITKVIDVRIKNVILPEKSFDLTADTKNISDLFFKIMDTKSLDLDEFNQADENLRRGMLDKLPVIRTLNEKTNDKKDFNSVHDDYTMKGLPLGQYVIVASNTNSFKESYSFAFFQASKLTYSLLNDGKASTLLVVDRISGKAESGVSVTLRSYVYDYQNRKQKIEKTVLSKTNKNGTMPLPVLDQRNFFIELVKKKDKLIGNQNHYSYNYNQPDNGYQSIEIFTDRAIYRPGQQVYFKAIALKYDRQGIPSIRPKEKLTVALHDANGQLVQQLMLTTNDFGSASGSFTVPIGLLTGIFNISTDFGGKSISVEEYKRPTFEVIIDSTKESPSLGDMIRVKGSAIGFAGNGISSGKVSYSVERYFSMPWYRWSMYPHMSAERVQLIADETITDTNGKFSLSFVADVEEGVNEEAMYHYEVQINVLDQSGESRSISKTYVLSRKSIILSSDVNESYKMEDLTGITIFAKNVEGTAVKVKGKYKIEKLIEPKDISTLYDDDEQEPRPGIGRKRYIQNPSSEKSPYEVLSVEKTIVEAPYKSDEKILCALKPGIYRVTATTIDAKEKEVKLIEHLTVYDLKKGKYPHTKFLFADFNQQNYSPGDKLSIKLGTPDGPLYVYGILHRGNDIISQAWYNLKSTAEIKYDITDKDFGGLSLLVFYAKENVIKTESFQINVPWTSKLLDIEFLTFRDKLLPGQSEQWKLKIKGSSKDHVLAELLLSMYDASLDQFVPSNWKKEFYPNRYTNLVFQTDGTSWYSLQQLNYYWQQFESGDVIKAAIYPKLLSFDPYYSYRDYDNYSMGEPSAPEMLGKSDMKRSSAPQANQSKMESNATADEASVDQVNGDEPSSKEQAPLSPRVNLKETVFFMPNLETDKEGNIIVDFKMNEALTKWRLLGFAHTKDFKFGFTEKFIQTKKELMIIANSPRFVRQGDEIWFTARVSNLSDNAVTALAKIDLSSDGTGQTKNAVIASPSSVSVSLNKGESKAVAWKLTVPFDELDALKYVVSAQSGQHTDGEEGLLPVLTNRILITETMPFIVRGGKTNEYTLENLKNNTSTSLEHYKYTIETSSSPVWYAVQALPYILEQNDQCVTQLIDRYYANGIASNIVSKNPEIKTTFSKWQNAGGDALKSNLEKNQDLKLALLKETPWIQDAQSEEIQKKNIAKYFDKNSIDADLSQTLQKIKSYQSSNGAFFWFPGMRENLWLTLYTLESIGKMKKAEVVNERDIVDMYTKAITYVDGEVLRMYTELKKLENEKKIILADYQPGNDMVNILYIRSFYPVTPIAGNATIAYKYYEDQMAKFWNKYAMYTQAELGTLFHRHNNSLEQNILKSFKEKAVKSDKKGMYWNEGSGYHWYEMPIERHVMIMEFFNEADTDSKAMDEMKVWLLTNKQVNNWKTGKATASAVHGLLMSKGNRETSLSNKLPIQIILNNNEVLFDNLEAGSLYNRKTFDKKDIHKSMATIKIGNPNVNAVWASVFWQYFEDINKVKSASNSPLTISKDTYKEVTSDKGTKLIKIEGNANLSPGDVVVSRITLKNDRDMEYIHLKDMRASGFEPFNVLSGYKWGNTVGYYESIRDLATHYFISYLPKGVHVFESRQKVVHKGNFSGGIAWIESYYAPEFSGHSGGEEVIVE